LAGRQGRQGCVRFTGNMEREGEGGGERERERGRGREAEREKERKREGESEREREITQGPGLTGRGLDLGLGWTGLGWDGRRQRGWVWRADRERVMCCG